MKITHENGWRFYHCQKLCEGRIGINNTRRPKWFPDACPLNSTWISREEAANTLKLERAFS
jgi:hypothetical protein